MQNQHLISTFRNVFWIIRNLLQATKCVCVCQILKLWYHIVFKGYKKTENGSTCSLLLWCGPFLSKERCVTFVHTAPTKLNVSSFTYRPNLGTALCNVGIILLIDRTHLFALSVCLKKCQCSVPNRSIARLAKKSQSFEPPVTLMWVIFV